MLSALDGGPAQALLLLMPSRLAPSHSCSKVTQVRQRSGWTLYPRRYTYALHSGGVSASGVQFANLPRLEAVCKTDPNRFNPFMAMVTCACPCDQGWCLVLQAVPTAPVAPVHRSKAPGGRDWVSLRGLQASLGSFRRSARLALAMTHEGRESPGVHGASGTAEIPCL